AHLALAAARSIRRVPCARTTPEHGATLGEGRYSPAPASPRPPRPTLARHRGFDRDVQTVPKVALRRRPYTQQQGRRARTLGCPPCRGPGRRSYDSQSLVPSVEAWLCKPVVHVPGTDHS